MKNILTVNRLILVGIKSWGLRICDSFLILFSSKTDHGLGLTDKYQLFYANRLFVGETRPCVSLPQSL
ncbi:hypothetical protein M595_4845 [Lyngbya aestuarii BL J]|uniref:Uncharacterized protein n=1 Tax=Lyngbya aestuarii BL J TaxID=1348334 RepID=U7QFH2_9CYAN|nr:hypothetical protein M595_4845 [Lyngbya aestuarii BL J]